MARPQPQPAIRKAPARLHPVAPAETADEPPTKPVEEPMALFSTRLPRSTHRRLKVYAASTGDPIQDIVEAAITAHLDRAAVARSAS